MATQQQLSPQAQFTPSPANHPPPRGPSQDPYGFQQQSQQQAGFAPPAYQSDAHLIPLPNSRTSSYSSQAAPFPQQQQSLSPYGQSAPPALQQQSSYFSSGPYAPFGHPQSPEGYRPHRSSSASSHHSHHSNHSHHSHHSNHSSHSNRSHHSHHSRKEIPDRKTLGDTLLMMWDILKSPFVPYDRR